MLNNKRKCVIHEIIINKNSRLSVSLRIILLWDKSCRNPDLSLNTKLLDIFGSRVALYKMGACHRIKATDERLTSWLYIYTTRSRSSLNSGLPRTNPDSDRVEYLNQEPSDFKSSTLNHSTTLPPLKGTITHILCWHKYQYRDICFRRETKRI